MNNTSKAADGVLYKFRPFHLEEIKNENKDISRWLAGTSTVGDRRGSYRIAANSTNLCSFKGFMPYGQIIMGRYIYDDADYDNFVRSYPEHAILWKYNFALRRWTKIENELTSSNRDGAENGAVILFGYKVIVFDAIVDEFTSTLRLYIKGKGTELLDVQTSGETPSNLGRGVIYYNDSLYIIGHSFDHDYDCSVTELNLKTMTWKVLYKSEFDFEYIPVYRFLFAFDGKQIFSFNGPDICPLGNIPIFDIEKKKWILKRSIPAGANGFPNLITLSDTCQTETPDGVMVFMVVGRNFYDHYNYIWRLNLKTMQWTFFDTLSLPNTVYSPAVSVTVEGRLNIFGDKIVTKGGLYRTIDHKLYSSWIFIPKLSEICWEALVFYSPNIGKQSYDKLVEIGIPRKFINRLELPSCT